MTPRRTLSAPPPQYEECPMFTRLFVQNPIFTNVIAIIAVILGIVSLTRLPIALYPDITPPTIAVSCQLSRRGRGNRGQDRRRAHRIAGQRRGKHDLHVLHQRR